MVVGKMFFLYENINYYAFLSYSFPQNLDMAGICKKSSVSPLIALIVVFFGTGSWVAINGLWVELPLLVQLGIPEGYQLASYLTIIIQIANIGPLLFVIISYLTPKHVRLEVPTIYIIVSIGITACVLLIFFWDVTTYWDVVDDYRSTALLVLAFFLSTVDCTSSVAFTPFMSRFTNLYVTWYFIGEGFSALLPSLVALGQGVGGDNGCKANFTYVQYINGTEENCTDWMTDVKSERFPPEDFFIFLTAMMSSCGIAFILLNYLPQAKRELIPQERDGPLPGMEPTPSPASSQESYTMIRNGCTEPDASDKEIISEGSPNILLSSKESVYLFVILGWVSGLSNGVLPSIQSYSCGAYGLDTYLLAATIANIANPISCFVVFLWPQKSRTLVTVTAILGTVFGSFCMTTAVLSPSPPLQFSTAGDILIVFCWVCVSGFFTYTKATIGWILRNANDNRSLLIWFGAVTQIGSLIGALIMFPIVNSFNLFEGYYGDPCKDKVKCIPIE
ncbi:solute carrier family 52, riboflavin transporter, member 3-B-like [Anneissia japonica]|uniref:solute carrier family 52, riboflavin transporter, member 3-B-like n=1 Tax=Anneissia japonica TaxID=1529436 RepID=UPI00142564E1|nr:solute carrier family 52, riboflavin transporter, member 3-B-like [Anneissia japonica]